MNQKLRHCHFPSHRGPFHALLAWMTRLVGPFRLKVKHCCHTMWLVGDS